MRINESPHAVRVLIAFLKYLKVKVTTTTVHSTLLEHPDYPSLLAIKDCLSSWKIPNDAFRFEKQDIILQNLKFPCIVHLDYGGDSVAIIKQVSNNQIIIDNGEGKLSTLSEAEFLNKWNGVVLYAEKINISGEPNYRQSIFLERLNHVKVPALIVTTVLAICFSINFGLVSFPYLLILGIKFLGALTCALLLAHSVNSNSSFVKNVCGLVKNNNCNAVLNSKAAKITNWLSWSEVGMFYFTGSFFLLFFVPSSSVMLFWISVICLPFTLYSISYQYLRKNWCILCCIVQILLWGETLALIWFFSMDMPVITTKNLYVVPTLFCILLPVLIWTILKPLILDSQDAEYLEHFLKRFKYNNLLFEKFLETQDRFVVPIEICPIRLGSQNPIHIITMVSNPYCGPCQKAHKTIHELVEQRGDIQMEIIFRTANYDDEKRTKVARHLVALSLLEDDLTMGEAIDDWYNMVNSGGYDMWSSKYPVKSNEKIIEIIGKQSLWCDEIQIRHTPTIFINGYRLLEPYLISDLRYLLK